MGDSTAFMDPRSTRLLGIRDVSVRSGCACCTSAGQHDSGSAGRHVLTAVTDEVSAATIFEEDQLMTTITTRYRVSGMTCGHCVSAVQTEVSALDGVVDVAVDLQAGGISDVRITSTEPLSDEQLAAALDEAGDYHLAPAVDAP